MSDIVILGQGRWGKRLRLDYLKQDKVVRTWSHQMDPFDIPEVEMVIVAIPSPYISLTINAFTVDPDTPVCTAVKGLDEFGRLPSQTIKDAWKSKNISVMGGACISSEENLQLLIEPVSNPPTALEWAGILKNIYAIGFNIERATRGDNLAAVWFTKAWREMERAFVDFACNGQEYFADLVTTCMSDNSRNAKTGKMIAQGKKRAGIYFNLGGEVPEGIHTADMLNKYEASACSFYSQLPLLRQTVEKIVETGL